MGFDVGLMKFDRFDGALVRFLWWFNEISGELPYVKLTQLQKITIAFGNSTISMAIFNSYVSLPECKTWDGNIGISLEVLVGFHLDLYWDYMIY